MTQSDRANNRKLAGCILHTRSRLLLETLEPVREFRPAVALSRSAGGSFEVFATAS